MLNEPDLNKELTSNLKFFVNTSLTTEAGVDTAMNLLHFAIRAAQLNAQVTDKEVAVALAVALGATLKRV